MFHILDKIYYQVKNLKKSKNNAHFVKENAEANNVKSNDIN